MSKLLIGGEQLTDMRVIGHNPGQSGPQNPPPVRLDSPDSSDEILRRPQGCDAIAMHQLAKATKALDLNSPYAYLLCATDFADTAIVAETNSELKGFITGYHPPTRPEVLFVWQVAVAPRAQGGGLASAMLDALVARVRNDRRGHPLTVEATVAPSNQRSRALFKAFARRHGVRISEHPHFGAELLGADHENEPILRIGPITAALQRPTERRPSDAAGNRPVEP